MENNRQTAVALSIAQHPRRVTLRISPTTLSSRHATDAAGRPAQVTGLGAWPDAWYYPYFAG